MVEHVACFSVTDKATAKGSRRSPFLGTAKTAIAMSRTRPAPGPTLAIGNARHALGNVLQVVGQSSNTVGGVGSWRHLVVATFRYCVWRYVPWGEDRIEIDVNG